MRVPAAVLNTYEPHACLNESRGEQTALSESMVGEKFGNRLRLQADVKGATGPRRAENIVCALRKAIEGLEQVAVLLVGAEFFFQVGAQSLPPFDLRDRQPAVERDSPHGEWLPGARYCLR